MQLNEDLNHQPYRLQSYHAGKLVINKTEYISSVILTAHHLIHPWRPDSINMLTNEDMDPIIALAPEILLLGTGEKHCHVQDIAIANLINAGIAVEVMSTSAACRTFTLLASDNRSVAAALLIN